MVKKFSIQFPHIIPSKVSRALGYFFLEWIYAQFQYKTKTKTTNKQKPSQT